MARPSNTDERREQITGALVKVMAKRGYDGASIADIAKAAGLTPGLVHYHFKNKREILLAALNELSARHTANLTTRLAGFGSDPIAELEAFVDFHLGLGSDADPEGLAMWILLGGEALRDARVRVEFTRAVERTRAILERILQRGVAEKAFTCHSVEAAASALVALIHGYFVLAATARSLIPKGSAALAAKRMAEGLLRPRRPLLFPGSEIMNTAVKLGVLGSLYFSQGLPFGFFTQALPVLLRKEGYSLGQIGLSSLLALPWALKFLWAPAVDRYSSARFGRRKWWIVPLQLAAVAILLALAAGNTLHFLQWVMAAVLLLNLVAATQDIATDGLAVDLLSPGQRGLGNGLQVAGYRVGMIVGGGALLVFYDRLGASLTFSTMAGLTALATLPIWFAREPEPSFPRADLAPVHFLRRPGVARLLVLLVVYKAGDAFATGMLRPYLTDIGLGLSDIGLLLGTVGFVAGLLGALAGGALVNRIGRKPALIAFGLLQAVTVAGYAALALGKPGLPELYVLCGVEHFSSGMATAALFTCMMDWCSRESGATDYTVQASAVVIATGAAGALGGMSAQTLGYFGHFCLAVVLALVAVAAVHRLFPKSEPCA